MSALFSNKFLVVISLIWLATGCGQTPVNQTAERPANENTNIQPVATAPPITSPTPAIAEATTVTLPTLGALLSDDEFVARAKSEQNLTDQEIEKLRDAARTAVSGLSDDNADDDARSTKTAADEAQKQVQAVLGDERGARFLTFVNTGLSEGLKPASGSAPNQIPTDTRVVVNAPAYRMDIFENGNLVKSYKIGIGYPEFPLPSGLRSAKAIIFNPTWTPPDEPWVNGKFEPGKKVEAGSKLNPLGPIKIPIGSPSLIHGGKSAARLGSFASHGCVGLTNAGVQDFAMTIGSLSGDAMSLTDVKAYEKAKTETKQVPLGKPIPVELRYETIVVENGTLKLYRDVYERGTNTEENLKRVLQYYGVSLDSLQADVRQKIFDALKEMSKDSSGNTVTAPANVQNSNKKPTSDRITSNVKGKKEIVFQLPELKGKGYPAPKNLRAN